MHLLYIFFDYYELPIYKYRTRWKRIFLQPYTPNQLRIFVFQLIQLHIHIDNKIVYRMLEALLHNKFCSSMVQIIYYALMLIKLCHVKSNIAVPACNAGKIMTAACVIRAQPCPVAAEQWLTLNDTKLSVRRMTIADWSKNIYWDNFNVWNRRLSYILCIWWCLSLGWAVPGRRVTGTIVTCSTGTTNHALTEFLPCVMTRLLYTSMPLHTTWMLQFKRIKNRYTDFLINV